MLLLVKFDVGGKGHKVLLRSSSLSQCVLSVVKAMKINETCFQFSGDAWCCSIWFCTFRTLGCFLVSEDDPVYCYYLDAREYCNFYITLFQVLGRNVCGVVFEDASECPSGSSKQCKCMRSAGHVRGTVAAENLQSWGFITQCMLTRASCGFHTYMLVSKVSPSP